MRFSFTPAVPSITRAHPSLIKYSVIKISWKMNRPYEYSRQVNSAAVQKSSDSLPDYVQTVVVKDSKGLEKVLLLPKALDLDRPKRSRTAFAKWQLDALEATFCAHPYLVGEQRTLLARRLGLSETQIKVWYQNRRTKQRKEIPSSLPVAGEPSPPREVCSTQVSHTSNNNAVSSNVPLVGADPAIRWAPPTSYEPNHLAASAGLLNQAALQYRTNIYQQFIESYGGSIGSAMMPHPHQVQHQHHHPTTLAAGTSSDRHHQRIF